jgi:hypothetical protein
MCADGRRPTGSGSGTSRPCRPSAGEYQRVTQSLDLPPQMHDAAQEVDVLYGQAERLALPQAELATCVSERPVPLR